LLSSELEEDAIFDVVDTIANEIGVAFAAKEDDCAFNGTGTSTYGKMRGIGSIVLDGSHAKAKVTASVNTYGALIAADLAALQGRCARLCDSERRVVLLSCRLREYVLPPHGEQRVSRNANCRWHLDAVLSGLPGHSYTRRCRTSRPR
jgi:hypothetical protein